MPLLSVLGQILRLISGFCSPVTSLLSSSRTALTDPENDPRGHSVRSGLSAGCILGLFVTAAVSQHQQMFTSSHLHSSRAVRVLRTQSQHRCVCAPVLTLSPEPERGNVKQCISSPRAHPSERADDERART